MRTKKQMWDDIRLDLQLILFFASMPLVFMIPFIPLAVVLNIIGIFIAGWLLSS